MDYFGKAVSSHLCWVCSTRDIGSVEPGFPTLLAQCFFPRLRASISSFPVDTE